MGWASGCHVFDSLAEAILDCDFSDAQKQYLIEKIICALQDNDWDTETEISYLDNKIVRNAYVAMGLIDLDEDEDDD